MPVLLLMLAIGLAVLSRSDDPVTTIALGVWCGVVGLMLAFAWSRRVRRRRSAESAPSLLDLDAAPPPRPRDR